MRGVTARELMSAPVETILDSADMREAAQRMSRLRISRLLVFDDQNEAIGTVSIGDVVKASAPRPTARSCVRDVMSCAIVTCRPGASLHGAVRGMTERRSRSVVVTEDGDPVGVLTRWDILKIYAEGGAVDYASSVSAVMSSPGHLRSPRTFRFKRCGRRNVRSRDPSTCRRRRRRRALGVDFHIRHRGGAGRGRVRVAAVRGTGPEAALRRHALRCSRAALLLMIILPRRPPGGREYSTRRSRSTRSTSTETVDPCPCAGAREISGARSEWTAGHGRSSSRGSSA